VFLVGCCCSQAGVIAASDSGSLSVLLVQGFALGAAEPAAALAPNGHLQALHPRKSLFLFIHFAQLRGAQTSFSSYIPAGSSVRSVTPRVRPRGGPVALLAGCGAQCETAAQVSARCHSLLVQTDLSENGERTTPISCTVFLLFKQLIDKRLCTVAACSRAAGSVPNGRPGTKGVGIPA